ncbi:helix-turn-helix domain-containing protein [Pseudomonas monteilii]|uniref:helix-turn-helix domain-containing protein n=1 Tax=Pseudomonas monteilii TaxID=76759 RepID=UPI003D0836A7
MSSEHKPSDARRLDHQVLQALRERAVLAVEKGYTVDNVAEIFGLHRRTIFRWIADFRVGGMEALLARPVPGRPKKKELPPA